MKGIRCFTEFGRKGTVSRRFRVSSRRISPDKRGSWKPNVINADGVFGRYREDARFSLLISISSKKMSLVGEMRIVTWVRGRVGLEIPHKRDGCVCHPGKSSFEKGFLELS